MDNKQSAKYAIRLVILLLGLGVSIFLFCLNVKAGVVAVGDAVTITAIVPANNAIAAGVVSGGGGSPSSAQETIGNTVQFRGMAYPGSIVSLLQDSLVVAEVPAGPDASFRLSLSGVKGGTYNYAIRAQDLNGKISALQLYTVVVTSGVTTLIDGIFIAPTISLDKTEVARGDPITFFGKSIPKADVSLVVNSDNNILKKTTADDSGSWFYKLDTLELEFGNHQVKARGATDADFSPFSQTLAFKVGTVNKLDVPPKAVPAEIDLNNDQRVNISDFSIMAYWYRRSDFPKAADLNHDGKVDLADFSILAYYWTG